MMNVIRYKKSTKPPSSDPTPAKKSKVRRKFVPWVVGIIIFAAIGFGGGIYLVLSQAKSQNSAPKQIARVTEVKRVTALGRLEPEGEVIKLSVSNAQDSRVNKLLVKEGDRVKAEQVIAILQGLDKKKAELAEAKQNVVVYQAKLIQIQAGEAKNAEITAQKANIARLEAQLRTQKLEREAEIFDAKAELRNAEINYQRYQTLHQQGAETAQKRDNAREAFERAQAKLNQTQAHMQNTVSTLQEQIAQERAMLEKLKEVRPVDLKVAQAELQQANTQVKRIKAELEDLYVRVPVAGRILKINTRVGEQVNTSQGIVELGRIHQMYAIAEVYETDVGLVKPGQRASVISEHGGFDKKIHGTVDHIGMQIKKQDVLSADPAADKDARVVEVKVRIDPKDNDRVAGLTNLQVRITIDLERRV